MWRKQKIRTLNMERRPQTTQQTETAKEETSDQELKEVKELQELLVKLVTIKCGWFDSDLRKKIKPIPGLATTHCVPDKK